MTKTRPTVGVLSALIALGCANDFSTELEGKPCSKSGECLAGYRCVDDVCIDSRTASGAGGSLPAEAGTGGAAVTDASGAGGASSGGTSVGGAATGGTDGGATDAASAGGASTDGGAGGAPITDSGAGGAAPEAGAGGAPVLDFTGVTCDDARCNPGQVCCVSDYPGFPEAADPEDFSCRSSASGCGYSLACDGDHDCGSNLFCCGTQTSGGNWRVACNAACPTFSGSVRVGCTRQAHCDADEVCCGTWNTSTSHFRSILCASSCTGDRFCASAEECAPGETCEPATSTPGFGICR